MNNQVLNLKPELEKALTFEINNFYLLVFTGSINLPNLEIYMNNHKNMINPNNTYSELEESVLELLLDTSSYFSNSYSSYLKSRNIREYILDVLQISNNYISKIGTNELLLFHTKKMNQIKAHFEYLDLYKSFENENMLKVDLQNKYYF